MQDQSQSVGQVQHNQQEKEGYQLKLVPMDHLLEMLEDYHKITH